MEISNTRVEKSRSLEPCTTGMSLTRSFFTFVRTPRQRECIKRQQETRPGNVHVLLHPPEPMEEETMANAFRKPIGPSASAYRAEIVEETKIKTELSRGRGIDGSMEGFIAARTS